MASSITIANGAALILGEAPITSLADATVFARAAKAAYDPCRQAELQATNWSFALTRANMAANATAPVWGFTTAFPYPSDAIRIVQVGSYFVGLTLTNYRTTDEVEYALEKRQILTNMSAPLPIRYVADITDAQQFAPLFADAVSHRIAWRICKRVTQSDALKASIRSDYAIVIQEAIRANAVEKPPVALPDDSWVISRI